MVAAMVPYRRHADNMKEDMSDSVQAQPSATVVLVRAGSSAPEILMVRRRSGDAFGDSYAFPGGVVDDDEAQAQPYCHGRTDAEASAVLGLPRGGLSFYCAAVRELFEETGVLLARDTQGRWAFSGSGDAAAKLRELRQQRNGAALPWSQLLRQHELRVACDALHYVSFWETPLRLPRRWAARFFLARIPPGQDARHDGRELTDSRWMTATEILAAGGERGMKLPFPTLCNLRDLAEFATVDEMLACAGARSAPTVARDRPVGKARCGERA
ncbi:MAG: NUDIX hydrolase [Gammaproteobacteria bacterium]|nr:MAG: NUDIX hydrolase [Gammaproteobacteria bacterium]